MAKYSQKIVKYASKNVKYIQKNYLHSKKIINNYLRNTNKLKICKKMYTFIIQKNMVIN